MKEKYFFTDTDNLMHSFPNALFVFFSSCSHCCSNTFPSAPSLLFIKYFLSLDALLLSSVQFLWKNNPPLFSLSPVLVLQESPLSTPPASTSQLLSLSLTFAPPKAKPQARKTMKERKEEASAFWRLCFLLSAVVSGSISGQTYGRAEPTFPHQL